MRSQLFAAVVLASCVASCIGDGEEIGDEDETALFEQAYDEGQQPGKEDGTDCSGVRVPDRNGFGKRIALTFDDGPNPATTPKVIEVLKRHHAPATFFINGSKLSVPGAAELARQVAADPDFILGNHSQNHQDLASLSLDRVAREMDLTDAGVRAAGETPKYFRFPFGSSTCNTMKMAKDRGWVVTGWHIDSADWCYAAGGGTCKKSTFKYVPDDMRGDIKGYVLSQVRSTGGGVILFHDIHSYTATNLDRLLTALEAEGYTFVRLDDKTVFPRLHGITPKFIGDACTTNADCNFAGGRCHAAGFCTQSCAGACPDATGKAPTFCIAETASTGMCVAKAAVQNQQCAALPGTQARELERFIGASGAAPARATVCAPR
ncbi:MAG: polysaccharide deacetylase family protein [Kofleriaceae bacterium]|nr:polysaccharide deacetylase family protein [Kofleriaceae bacterium]